MIKLSLQFGKLKIQLSLTTSLVLMLLMILL